jgi:hypothetical protein
MMATYSRTYLDANAWRQRRGLLLGSLAVFAVGPAAVLASALSGSDAPFLGFLAFATAYGYWHVVRQHYGFFALYGARGATSTRGSHTIDRWTLQAGCWAPYVHFLVMHPRSRQLMGLDGEPPSAVGAVLVAAWLASLVVLGARAFAQPASKRSTPQLAYAALVLVLHGLAYFVVGRFEPVYSASTGPDEDFLLLSVMLSVFHATQYVALVWIHNRSRYAAENAGAASWMSTSPGRFAVACLAFTAVYAIAASATGVFPVVRSFVGAKVGSVSINRLALSFWWGLALHHYILDQRIWRFGEDPELRRHLGVA